MPAWNYSVLGKQFVEGIDDVVYGTFIRNLFYKSEVLIESSIKLFSRSYSASFLSRLRSSWL